MKSKCHDGKEEREKAWAQAHGLKRIPLTSARCRGLFGGFGGYPTSWVDHPCLWKNAEGRRILTTELYDMDAGHREKGRAHLYGWADERGWTVQDKGTHESFHYPGRTTLFVLTEGEEKTWRYQYFQLYVKPMEWRSAPMLDPLRFSSVVFALLDQLGVQHLDLPLPEACQGVWCRAPRKGWKSMRDAIYAKMRESELRPGMTETRERDHMVLGGLSAAEAFAQKYACTYAYELDRLRASEAYE